MGPIHHLLLLVELQAPRHPLVKVRPARFQFVAISLVLLKLVCWHVPLMSAFAWYAALTIVMRATLCRISPIEDIDFFPSFVLRYRFATV